MGFWDSVVGAAKSAGQAVSDKAKQQQNELWKQMSRLPKDRLLDTFEHSDNRIKKAMVLMALVNQDSYKAKQLLTEDMKQYLKRRRSDLALEESNIAEEQRQAIDSLLR